MGDTPAANWQRYWQILERIGHPELQPDLQAFGDLLARSGVEKGSRRHAGRHPNSAAPKGPGTGALAHAAAAQSGSKVLPARRRVTREWAAVAGLLPVPEPDDCTATPTSPPKPGTQKLGQPLDAASNYYHRQDEVAGDARRPPSPIRHRLEGIKQPARGGLPRPHEFDATADPACPGPYQYDVVQGVHEEGAGLLYQQAWQEQDQAQHAAQHAAQMQEEAEQEEMSRLILAGTSAGSGAAAGYGSSGGPSLGPQAALHSVNEHEHGEESLGGANPQASTTGANGCGVFALHGGEEGLLQGEATTPVPWPSAGYNTNPLGRPPLSPRRERVNMGLQHDGMGTQPHTSLTAGHVPTLSLPGGAAIPLQHSGLAMESSQPWIPMQPSQQVLLTPAPGHAIGYNSSGLVGGGSFDLVQTQGSRSMGMLPGPIQSSSSPRQTAVRQAAQGQTSRPARSGKAAESPRSRFNTIQARVDHMNKPTELAAGSGAAKEVQASPLAAWAAAWSSGLARSVDQVIGAAAARLRMSRLERIMSGVGGGGIEPDGESSLTKSERQVHEVNRALELLDKFTLAAPNPRTQQLARQMEDRIDYAAEKDSGSTTRSMPKAPHTFPVSAAWDYLVAAQREITGVPELETAVVAMRKRIKVVVGSQGFARGMAGSDAMQPIEKHLGISSLAAVTSQLSFGMSESVTAPGSYLNPAQMASLHDTPRTDLSRASFAPANKGSPLRESKAGMALPPSCVPGALRTSGALGSVSAYSLPASPSTPVIGSSSPFAEAAGRPSVGGTGRPPSGGRPTSGNRFSTPSANLSASLDSAAAVFGGSRRVNSAGVGAGGAGPKGRVTLNGIPRASMAGVHLGGWGASVADVSASTGVAGGVYGGGFGSGGLHAGSSLMNLGAAFKASTGDSEAELCWTWLENLMISMQETEAIRLEVAAEAKAVGEKGLGGGLAEAGDDDAPVTRIPAAVNPHTAGPVGADKILMIDTVMDSAKGMLRGAGSRSMNARHEDPVEAAKRSMPYVDANALRVATAAYMDPANLERVLFFLLRLAVGVEQGSLPPRDCGFLLAVGLELLCGELQWLLAMLRVTQGPASPHLRALHAALRAYEAQESYAQSLAARTSDFRQELQETLKRARHAEQQLAQEQVEARSGRKDADSLMLYVRELEQENAKLKTKVSALEHEVQALHADVDQHEASTQARSQVLHRAETFRSTSRKWHAEAVGALSKGTQAATAGDAGDPWALPLDLRGLGDQGLSMTAEARLAAEDSQADAGAGAESRGLSRKLGGSSKKGSGSIGPGRSSLAGADQVSKSSVGSASGGSKGRISFSGLPGVGAQAAQGQRAPAEGEVSGGSPPRARVSRSGSSQQKRGGIKSEGSRLDSSPPKSRLSAMGAAQASVIPSRLEAEASEGLGLVSAYAGAGSGLDVGEVVQQGSVMHFGNFTDGTIPEVDEFDEDQM